MIREQSMPSSAIFTFTDPHPYQAAIRAAEIEILPTNSGEFHAELVQINLHRLWMQCGQENLPRVFRSTVSPQRAPIVFLTAANQAAMQHSGLEVTPGAIIVDGLGATHHHRSWGPCQWGTMSLAPDDLMTLGYSLTGREISPPSATYLLRPARPLMARLLRLHDEVRQLAKTAPNTLAHPEVARALEQSLLLAMLSCLTEGTTFPMTTGGRHHSAVVARLEQFLEENQDRPLYSAEICAACGASERTLRISCQEHVGMSPVRYLWLRRMHLARRRLIMADQTKTTVTELAAELGFWELGRFSVQYRALFGEPPSATLRRPPDDRKAIQNRPSSLPTAEFA
jgi:AraC-like DNA-binding protein